MVAEKLGEEGTACGQSRTLHTHDQHARGLRERAHLLYQYAHTPPHVFRSPAPPPGTNASCVARATDSLRLLRCRAARDREDAPAPPKTARAGPASTAVAHCVAAFLMGVLFVHASPRPSTPRRCPEQVHPRPHTPDLPYNLNTPDARFPPRHAPLSDVSPHT